MQTLPSTIIACTCPDYFSSFNTRNVDFYDSRLFKYSGQRCQAEVPLLERRFALWVLWLLLLFFFFLLHHSCYKLVLYSVGSPGCLLPPLESITLLIICAVSSTTLFCNSPGARLHQLLLLVIPVGDAIWFCPRSFSFFFFLFFPPRFCPRHISGTITRRDSKLSVPLGPAV